MKFDTTKFLNDKFEARTADVPVPDLRDWFTELEEGETPAWKVRGLTHSEIAKAIELSATSNPLEAAVKAIAGSSKDKENAIKEIIGITDDVPVDTARRIYHLVYCSVEPEVDRSFAVRLSNTHPIEFTQITNKILELTAKGQIVGKPNPSGREMISAVQ